MQCLGVIKWAIIMFKLEQQMQPTECMNDGNADCTFVVQGQEVRIRRQLLKLKQQKKPLKSTILPDWITIPLFSKLQSYLSTGQLPVYNSLQQLQKLLWMGDLLHLQPFLQSLIQHLLPNISLQNVMMLFHESQKKLKHCIEGPKYWYNLLNTCTTYIAANLKEVYNRHEKELRKAPDRIMNQILERSVKHLKRMAWRNKEEVYGLVGKLKEGRTLPELCAQMKEAILKKKSNPQMHANLAWKLVGLKDITSKQTKVFKFLDYDWRLAAQASETPKKQRKLTISLLMQRPQSHSQSQPITSSQSSQPSSRITEPQTPHSSSQSSQFLRIGVMYFRLNTKIGQDLYQSDLRINYLSLDQRQCIDLLQFHQPQLNEISNKKVQLTIFCNFQQVYMFLLNYTVDSLNLAESELAQFSVDEAMILAKTYKKVGKMREAVGVVLALMRRKEVTEGKIREALRGVDWRGSGMAEVGRRVLLGVAEMGWNGLREEVVSATASAMQPERMYHTHQIKILHSGLQHDRVSETRMPAEYVALGGSRPDSRSRADSRGRADSRQARSRNKKIFDESPKKRQQPQDREEEKRRMLRDLDIRNFIYQKDSAFYRTFSDLSL